MRLLSLSVLTVSVGLSACATVDFAEMAPQAPTVFEASSKTVVRRATDTLVDRFVEAGWVTPPEQNHIQKTAGFLLKGMKKTAEPQGLSYAERASDISIVKSDIRSATAHIEQAVKAADVFLAMATPDEKLRRELKSLEKALVATRKAEAGFEKALKRLGATSADESMNDYRKSVGELTRTTNAYGTWVREGQSIKPVGGAS